MFKKEKNFICIGAVHVDYIFKLKKNYFRNRTNPVNIKKYLGGVGYNIAEKLASLRNNTTLISFNLKNDQKNLKNKNINFKFINKKIFNRSYTSILNFNDEMIIGMADMECYEKNIIFPNFKADKNSILVFDLNFSKNNIKSLLLKYYGLNYICVCGTSAHKIYKIRNLLNKINLIILNKKESLELSKKNNIYDALKYIIKKNKKLNVIITNGKYNVTAYYNNNIYKCKPPIIKVKNENKAGDFMAAYFVNYFFKNFLYEEALSKSIIAGSLYASGLKYNIQKYSTIINKMNKKIKIVKRKYK
tara:strand:- start:74 stop:982 length:909 start_codon:yes stop_codon:yes gene_type:complete